MSSLHSDAIVIDGLVISKWSRAVFEDMHRGGLTAANCTCSVWEDFRATMKNVARWKKWFREHEDILLQVHTSRDIERARREGKVGIFLGWQNTSAIEDDVELLGLFRDLGVRVMQLTYNARNRVGSGCWEEVDEGLTPFGREIVEHMNALGILVDLSHVGERTSREAILHSSKPVAFTHCCPSGLKDHPRNKSDEQLRMIAERGGFVGVATYPPFLPRGNDSTLDDCVDVLEYVIDLVGEDCVGIGTDFTQDQDLAFFEWLRLNPATGRSTIPGKASVPVLPEGLRRLSEYPNLTAAMQKRRWPEERIRKVIGLNWLRLLRDVWGN